MPMIKSKANLGTVEKVQNDDLQNDDFWVWKCRCMRKPVLFLMAVLGLTMSTLSTQAGQCVITDVMNNVCNTNNGGGNQDQSCGNGGGNQDQSCGNGGGDQDQSCGNGGGNQQQGCGSSTCNTPDVARVTVQRSSCSGENYVLVWQGVVDNNGNPPCNAVKVPCSDTTLSNPPNLDIDFSFLLLNGTIAPPVDCSTIYSIAAVEVNGYGNTQTIASAQFNFPNLSSQLQNTFNINTQFGQR